MYLSFKYHPYYLTLLGFLISPLFALADAPVEESQQVTLTIESYESRLLTEIDYLSTRLDELESQTADPNGTAAFKRDLELIRKEIGNKETKLLHLQESYLLHIDFLADALEALRSNGTLNLVPELESALSSGNLDLVDKLLEQAQSTLPKNVAAEAFFNRGTLSKELGDYRTAFSYFEQALAIEASHRSYLIEASALAAEMGFYAKALEYAEDAVLLPSELDDSTTDISVLSNLGEAQKLRANFTEALEHFDLALEVALAKKGNGSIEVAESRMAIGSLYSALGDSRTAIDYYQAAIENLDATGDAHLRFKANTNLALAFSARDLGEYSKSKILVERAAETYESLGPSARLDLASTKQSLGTLHSILAEYDDAVERFAEARAVYSIELGEDHPNIGSIDHSIAIVLLKLGRYKAARDRSLAVLDNHIINYGETHPKVGGALLLAGECCMYLKDFGKGIEYTEKALEIHKNAYGEKHPAVALDLNNLGSCYDTIGEHHKAIEMLNSALDINLSLYGENHMKVATCENNLGTAYSHLEEFDPALRHYFKALEIDQNLFSDSHPRVANRWNNIAVCYLKMGKFPTALEYLLRVRESYKNTLGENHPLFATNSNNLAGCYSHLGEYQKAIELHEEALRILVSTYETPNSSLSITYSSLGRCLLTVERYSEALEVFAKSYEINSNLRYKNPRQLANDQINTGFAYKGLGEIQKAITHLNEGLAILKSALGQHHPEIQALEKQITIITLQL